jgi:hypothetical protein
MTKEIELADNVLIQCPEKSFNFRIVKHCLTCEYYLGVQSATVNDVPVKGNEASDYQVLCGRPITRKLMQIESD